MALTATVMEFETCERKNNIVVYINSNGQFKMDETEWHLINQPSTFSINEIKRISNDLNRIEQNAKDKEKVVGNQVAQVVNNNTNERGFNEQGVIVLTSEKIEKSDGNIDEDHVNQKYQF